MKLDRNINEDGVCKYGIVTMRRAKDLRVSFPDIQTALTILQKFKLLLGTTIEDVDEFFVLKLRDEFAAPALEAYEAAVLRKAGEFDVAGQHAEARSLREYANEILDLCNKAKRRDDKKIPD